MEPMQCPSCGSPAVKKTHSSEYRCDNCYTIFSLPHVNESTVDGRPCHFCKYVNDKDARYCGGCGGLLLKSCRKCGNDVWVEMAHCPECGGSQFDDQHSMGSDLYDVILTPGGRDYQKIQVIKIIKPLNNLSLAEAKKLSENKSRIGANLPLQDASELKYKIQQLGGIAEIEPSHSDMISKIEILEYRLSRESNSRSCLTVFIFLVSVWMLYGILTQ